MTYDVVIRGGHVIDGTGTDGFDADIAIKDGRIVAVGPDLGPALETVDATGLLVTPGFVDIHTHYDGQVIWESTLTPSTDHGVTTIVTGNCGVGFAPCRPEDHDELVQLMAGVEDIPEVVMTEGLDWSWTTFPQYLDAVASRAHDVDIAAMLPHSALRVYVMGERAVRREEATGPDIERMAELTREAMAAGAIGFGTSRALQQKSLQGESIPTVRAAEDELRGILGAVAESGPGVFQALSDFDLYEDVEGEFAMFRRLVASSGCPMSFTLHQKHGDPDGWRELLAQTEMAVAAGLPIKAQVAARASGLLMGHELSRTPFTDCPTYASLATLPLADRVERLRDPAVRRQILAEVGSDQDDAWNYRFELTDPPNYEPAPEDSLAARAAREGTTAAALAYDLLLEDDGRRVLLSTAQDYADGSSGVTYELMNHKDTVLGLGDGGAHLGLICDASYPTTILAHWTRDRSRGPRLTVPAAVKSLTADTASVVGLHDRGRIAPGFRADINVIDYDALLLRAPQVVHDLPAGGRRVVQRADGYVATFVNGVATRRNGEITGALPGRLVRGPQPAPAVG